MDRIFLLLAFWFLGGTAIAGIVSGNWWPLLCAVIALFILAKLFSRST